MAKRSLITTASLLLILQPSQDCVAAELAEFTFGEDATFRGQVEWSTSPDRVRIGEGFSVTCDDPESALTQSVEFKEEQTIGLKMSAWLKGEISASLSLEGGLGDVLKFETQIATSAGASREFERTGEVRLTKKVGGEVAPSLCFDKQFTREADQINYRATLQKKKGWFGQRYEDLMEGDDKATIDWIKYDRVTYEEYWIFNAKRCAQSCKDIVAGKTPILDEFGKPIVAVVPCGEEKKFIVPLFFESAFKIVYPNAFDEITACEKKILETLGLPNG